MSVWETIEDAAVSALGALTSGGSPLLATVKGFTSRDKKPLQAAIGRERLPAAYVIATGRDAGDKATRRPGSPAFTVLLATGSQRNVDDARIDGVDVMGTFTLSEASAGALQDLVVDGDRLMLLVDERPVGGADDVVLWEQRYEVRRQAETSAPTFGGVALAGSDSEVRVELGALGRASSSFSFPGVDGVFARDLGVRERAITWTGQLRAASDTALNTIETSIEDELRGSVEKAMVDAWGRSHASCVMRAFHRRGPRRRDELTGQALQGFEIEFSQSGG